eukprot:1162021-Pelagomonas_calceolata.AAC.12
MPLPVRRLNCGQISPHLTSKVFQTQTLSAKPVDVEKVTPDHLVEHFIKFVKNDNLGVIANAWLGHADWARSKPEHQLEDIINVK